MFTEGIWLRLARDGDALTAEWSSDGETWTAFGPTRSISSMTDPRIGLAAYNGAGQPAAFDFFRIDQGEPADTTGPDVAMTGIEDGATPGDSEVVELQVSATDSQSGLGSLAVDLDGERLAECGSPQSVTLDLWALELGDHVLEVTAVDGAGNRTVERIGFTVVTPSPTFWPTWNGSNGTAP
ncbi:hypothetical protein E1262_27860 [Jiangella aurantiaca]|uniref:Bacterial Ig-like domain-containing protein n=1 Tax=Jiangella aurantiaca TaxID=2530373 RepID=A0A4R5A206_9ACTN|nr:hypothetical protein [Jiangella aurantiaca]TDD64549.1 hypothetical protein E1262_27860 [Jiangella aurantiaca]